MNLRALARKQKHMSSACWSLDVAIHEAGVTQGMHMS
jgi:hypothetical protein